MNQPNESAPSVRAPSSSQKWLWILLSVFLVGAAGIAVLGLIWLKKAGGMSVLASFGGGIKPLDLSAFYDKSGSWDRGNEFQDIPRGPVTLGGVPFEVNGLVRLSGRSAKSDGKPYREEIKDIPVGSKFARLHVLHIVSYSTSQETPYARITLRYGDGTSSSFPLVYGKHGRDWHRPRYEYPSTLADPNSKVVWRGEYDSTPVNGKTLRIFKSTFINPKPDSDVVTIDLSSEMASPNATILSMSIGPAHLPRPADDPPSLPEPEAPYEGEIKITAVDAGSGTPVPNVTLKVSGSESGGSFRTPDVITDANGHATVPHPGDVTRTLTLVASGDGVAIKTFRWRTANGEMIPLEHTLKLDKGVAIGGVVQDPSGQPVPGATISLRTLASPGDQASRDNLPFTDATVTTDASGRWQFPSLPPGFTALSAAITHPDYVDANFLSDGVDRAYAGERVKFATLSDKTAVFTVRKGLVVAGRVLDEAGAPVSGAKLLLGNSRFESRPTTTRTDDTGAFRLTGAKAGQTFLTVQASGYAPQMKGVEVTEKTDPIEFKLAPGNVFKARIVDESGTPIRSARVTVDVWQNHQTIELSGSTDARGLVSFDSAPRDGMSGSIYKSSYMGLNGVGFVADGAEHTFTLRRSVTISADVVDAETKQPIERFDVTRGQNTGGDQVYWQTYNVTRGSNGMFSMRRDQASVTALKFEADDHLPAILSLGTNGETHFSVELKKGSGPKGLVVQPNGQPAPGARLFVLGPGRNLNLSLGSMRSNPREGGYAQADAKGAFSVRAQSDGERMLVMHTNGYAEAGYSNFVNGSTIRLEPWGTIEGLLTVSGKPGTNEAVLLTPGANTGRSSYWYEYSEYRTVTDNAGRFIFSNVPPGERRVVRLIPINQNSWSHSQPTDVMVKPGEVTQMQIGGNGHLLVGQLQLSDSEMEIDWTNSGYHSLNSFPQPPPFKSTEEYRAWAQSPATLEAQRKARSYTVQLSSTGAFRIEEVLPGTYQLNLSFQQPDSRGRLTGAHLGSLSTNVVVPVYVKGAPPIDLGTIVVRTRARGSATGVQPVKRAAVEKQ
jgi:protocatechuate 3,4-dioxygenase beta subunit